MDSTSVPSIRGSWAHIGALYLSLPAITVLFVVSMWVSSGDTMETVHPGWLRGIYLTSLLLFVAIHRDKYHLWHVIAIGFVAAGMAIPAVAGKQLPAIPWHIYALLDLMAVAPLVSLGPPRAIHGGYHGTAIDEELKAAVAEERSGPLEWPIEKGSWSARTLSDRSYSSNGTEASQISPQEQAYLVRLTGYEHGIDLHNGDSSSPPRALFTIEVESDPGTQDVMTEPHGSG